MLPPSSMGCIFHHRTLQSRTESHGADTRRATRQGYGDSPADVHSIVSSVPLIGFRRDTERPSPVSLGYVAGDLLEIVDCCEERRNII